MERLKSAAQCMDGGSNRTHAHSESPFPYPVRRRPHAFISITLLLSGALKVLPKPDCRACLRQSRLPRTYRPSPVLEGVPEAREASSHCLRLLSQLPGPLPFDARMRCHSGLLHAAGRRWGATCFCPQGGACQKGLLGSLAILGSPAAMQIAPLSLLPTGACPFKALCRVFGAWLRLLWLRLSHRGWHWGSS